MNTKSRTCSRTPSSNKNFNLGSAISPNTDGPYLALGTCSRNIELFILKPFLKPYQKILGRKTEFGTVIRQKYNLPGKLLTDIGIFVSFGLFLKVALGDGFGNWHIFWFQMAYLALNHGPNGFLYAHILLLLWKIHIFSPWDRPFLSGPFAFKPLYRPECPNWILQYSH